ncbi:MAG: hypothetical protein KatS3mg057_2507 [Herpetosiphonaceae bacterium]|nr:MAG: hypothetical protein KatS3mg057_2507 [Herpetosiphonaceae bacterium]
MLWYLDSHPTDQALARTLLEQAGWEVYTASTAALSFRLIRSWLEGSRDLRHTRVFIIFDLIMDIHGLHLAAIVRDEQWAGRFTSAALVGLTAGYSAENRHLGKVAGCDALLTKPLTASQVAQLAHIEPCLAQNPFPTEDEWLRRWLVEEGRRLLAVKAAHIQPGRYRWSPSDIAILLKILSGRGHQPADTATAPLVGRFGGYEQMRTYLAGLIPLLDAPYASLLSDLLAGASIAESGKHLGYGRSQSYVLFHRLAQRISQLLSQTEAEDELEPTQALALPDWTAP